MQTISIFMVQHIARQYSYWNEITYSLIRRVSEAGYVTVL